jgi:hypothetical protein
MQSIGGVAQVVLSILVEYTIQHNTLGAGIETGCWILLCGEKVHV